MRYLRAGSCFSVSFEILNLFDIRLDHDRIAQILERGVGILQAVAGQGADHDRARLESAARSRT